jgi:hypothetical protein
LYAELVSGQTSPAALGNNSVAIGSGATTGVSAPGSLAIGDQSLANLPGSMVQANGRFGNPGDAQAGRYLLRGITINSTATEIFIDGNGVGGSSVRLALKDNSTWSFTATVTGHRTDVGDGHAGYKFEGVIYRDAGAVTTAFQGTPIKTVLAESDAAWDANISVDTTNGSLKFTVAGEMSKQISWVTLVETVEITN